MHILKHTRRVTLELSNLCNYAGRHPRCPAHGPDGRQILPARIVYDVLGTLADCHFDGCLAWHVYNEPLLDPRLLHFVAHARKCCPDADVLLWSNGWYLDKTLAEELIAAGVRRLTLSAYSDKEYERFETLRERLKRAPIDGRPASVHVLRVRQLDGRLAKGPDGGTTGRRPCHAPLSDLTIRASGHVGLCCFDWAQRETFGNLHEAGFRSAMEAAAGRMEHLQAELTRGLRTLQVCRRCHTWRAP